MDGDMFTTLLGADVTISIMDGTVMVNNATVTVADITTDNGVVHVIDAVLLPPTPEVTPPSRNHCRQRGTHRTGCCFGQHRTSTKPWPVPGPFTVFAPTDAAFDALGHRGHLGLLTRQYRLDQRFDLPRCGRQPDLCGPF